VGEDSFACVPSLVYKYTAPIQPCMQGSGDDAYLLCMLCLRQVTLLQTGCLTLHAPHCGAALQAALPLTFSSRA
jgi:hypothetical protein